MNDLSSGATADLEAARILLARLGITPEQLLGTAARPTEMPTFDDYIERVAQAVSDGTRKLYTSYWNRIRQVWGDRRLDEPTPLEIKQLAMRFKADVVVRRNARGGRSAAEHVISALRCVYGYAVDDGLIAETANPAIRVAKPRRLASTRRALPDAQLAQVVEVAATTGNRPGT
jgi:integrase/recombinase XerC